MSHATGAVLATLVATLVAVPALAAGEGSDPLALPLAVVDAGAHVPPEVIDAVVAGIAAPVLRGDELRRHLSLADAGDPSASAALVPRGKRAADLFFAGDHEAARAEFEGLLAEIEGRPERMARDPGLRSVAFDARLFLAVIARLLEQEQLVDELLSGARRRYPELEPGTTDFPPWLRERHEAVPVPEPGEVDALTVDVPEGCGLDIDGREVTVGPEHRVRIGRDAHALRTRCGGGPGPVVLSSGRAPDTFRPIALFSTALSAKSGEVELAAKAGIGDDELVRDLWELARAAGTHRLAAVIGREQGAELWLVDVDIAGLARSAQVAPEADASAFERAGGELSGTGAADAARRPWYRDGTAWAFGATGLAAAATGLVLGQVYGGPSGQEPAAWALMASGAALAATGVVLFLVPAPDGAEDTVAFSAGAAISF